MYFLLFCILSTLFQYFDAINVRLLQPNGVMHRVPLYMNDTLPIFKQRCNLRDIDALYFKNQSLDTSLQSLGIQNNDILIAKRGHPTYNSVKSKFATLSSLQRQYESFVYDAPDRDASVTVPNSMYDIMMELAMANQSAVIFGHREIIKNRTAFHILGCMETSSVQAYDELIQLAKDVKLSIIGCVVPTIDSRLVTLPLYLRNTTDNNDIITIRPCITPPARKSHYINKPSAYQPPSLSLLAYMPTKFAHKLFNDGKLDVSGQPCDEVKLSQPISLESSITSSLDPLLLLSPIRITSNNETFSMRHGFREVIHDYSLVTQVLHQILYTAPIDIIRDILFDPYLLSFMKVNLDNSLYEMVCIFVLGEYNAVEELHVVDVLRSIF